MSIFDTFFSKPAAAPEQQPQQQQQPATVQPGNIPPNTQVSGQAPVTTEPQEKKDNSPLAEFSGLWDTPVNKGEGEDKSKQSFDLKPEDVKAAVEKINFTQTLNADTLARISAGGEEAAKAFAESLNQVAQSVMSQTMMVSQKLANKAVEDALAAQQSKLPGLVRDQNTSATVFESNPLFKDPAVRPVIDATRQQLQLKYPEASPAQIADMTKNYVLAMSKAFNPTVVTPSNPFEQSSDSTDWEKFLNGQ